MAKDKVLIIRGTLDWAKLLGPARPHTGEPRYDKGPYWSVEVTPDAKSMAKLKELGLDKGGTKGTGKLRTPSPKDTKRVGKGLYLPLKQYENKMSGGKPTGEKNFPPKIEAVDAEKWEDGNLGNGSVADVKIKVVDYGAGVEKGVYLQALRVLDHVIYESDSFEPLSEDDEYFSAPEDEQNVEAQIIADTGAANAFDADLDDDVPF